MSKKLLVPYSPAERRQKGSGFVVPVAGHSGPKFVSLPNLNEVEFGMVVYSGKEVESEFIFSKIVDLELKLLSPVAWQMQSIDEFLKTISKYKIGSILKLEYTSEKEMVLTKVKIIGTKL